MGTIYIDVDLCYLHLDAFYLHHVVKPRLICNLQSILPLGRVPGRLNLVWGGMMLGYVSHLEVIMSLSTSQHLFFMLRCLKILFFYFVVVQLARFNLNFRLNLASWSLKMAQDGLR